ncbi:hypothetical protein [Tuwongella immobilis]|uniref:Uncharacterized protein n=1 Tax=Tuwongella immobilis TaxID=692036 RepID=A0A6C2YJB5_9BACT|nr:hypothetical protein [Tuwongella immobilis]VIP01195.1 Uncharacterized protein OS=Xanthomonas arboricola pv. celebensis GN=IA64_06900 PE=4 SV=1 [Tuwongella immobilis]VTR97816.1 Uncharacterized protein OS=Xanthomonas arboricola pv. celebensis GN=IA64_06900 PE=4 SV=1 [Tuwongella immobilis]
MQRATICVDVGIPEQAAVMAWLDRWRSSLAFVSDNEGCGCCVDIYRVEAPPEALAELPPAVFAISEWSGSANAAPDAAATDGSV